MIEISDINCEFYRNIKRPGAKCQALGLLMRFEKKITEHKPMTIRELNVCTQGFYLCEHFTTCTMMIIVNKLSTLCAIIGTCSYLQR